MPVPSIPTNVDPTRARIGRRGLVGLAGVVGAATMAATRPAEAKPVGRHTIATVTEFGARGDGEHDDTAAIQHAIDSVAESGGGELRLPAGTFATSAPLHLRSLVHLIGEGDASCIHAASDANFGSRRAMIEILEASSASVRAMRLDQGGTGRNAFVNQISHSILVEQSHDIDLVELTFVENGYEDTYGWPTGPVLYLRGAGGKDASVERVLVSRCRFIQSDNLNLNFAIRAVTSWQDDGAGRCAHNTISECDFLGTWGWNTIEFAGPGTSQCSVLSCTFDGKAFTHIDFDKGVSHSVAAFNHLKSAGKPPHLIKNHNTRVAAINDHGNYNQGKGFRNANNVIAHNTIVDTMTDGGIDTLESAIIVSLCSSSLVVGNQITNVNNGARGGGIQLERDVTDAAIRDNNISGVKQGIWFNGEFGDHNGIRIEGNQITSTAESILVNKLPGHGRDITVVSNQVRPGATSAGIAFEPGTAECPIVALNTSEGGSLGIDIGQNEAIVVGNVVKRATISYGWHPDQAISLVGNVSLAPGDNDLADRPGRTSMLGNVFHGPQAPLGAPTTYGTEPPSSGEWSVGSVVRNSAPSSGGPSGWICVGAGTPGSWGVLGMIS